MNKSDTKQLPKHGPGIVFYTDQEATCPYLQILRGPYRILLEQFRDSRNQQKEDCTTHLIISELPHGYLKYINPTRTSTSS